MAANVPRIEILPVDGQPVLNRWISGVAGVLNAALRTLFGPFAGDVSGSVREGYTVVGLQSVPVVNTAPTDGEVLTYSSTSKSWGPGVGIAAGVLMNQPMTIVSGNTYSVPEAFASIMVFANGALIDAADYTTNGPLGRVTFAYSVVGSNLSALVVT